MMNMLTTPPACTRWRGYIVPVVALLLFSALSTPAKVGAQTLYVQPTAEIPLRRGQGSSYKIVAVVQDGTAVELIGQEGDWAQVQLKSGKEGWLLYRYLSKKPPLDKQVNLLSTEKKELAGKATALEQQLTELTEVNGQTEQNLSACIAERTDIRDKFEALQQDTADVQMTKKSLAEAKIEIEQLRQQLSDAQIENSVLKKNESIKWFMAGTGVLLLGGILGRFTKGSKKRRSSLLS